MPSMSPPTHAVTDVEFARVIGRALSTCSPVQQLPIADIRPLGQNVDESKVVRYTATFRENPSVMPPIRVALYNGVYTVADGHHRLEAAKRAAARKMRHATRNERHYGQAARGSHA